MATEPVIILHFLRHDGKREKATLRDKTMAQARALAESVFRKCRGLFTEVDICTDNGGVETLQSLSEPATVRRPAHELVKNGIPG